MILGLSGYRGKDAPERTEDLEKYEDIWNKDEDEQN